VSSCEECELVLMKVSLRHRLSSYCVVFAVVYVLILAFDGSFSCVYSFILFMHV